jgi:Flp pilus assembly protein TadD
MTLSKNIVGGFLLAGMLVLCQGAQAGSDEDSFNEFRTKGITALNRGDSVTAFFYLSRAMIFEPENVELYNEMGMAAEKAEKPDEAEQYYKAAIEKNVLYAPAYYNLGLFYLNLKKYALAEYYLNRRVALGKGDDPWTLKASQALERLYDESPEYRQRRAKMSALALETQMAEQAMRMRQNEMQARTIQFEAACRNGLEAFNNGEYPLAEEFFYEAVTLQPDNAEVRHSLERTREQLRRQRAVEQRKAFLVANKDSLIEESMERVQP